MSVLRPRSFHGFRFDPFKAPRRPRHRLLRWFLGTLGVALLLGLLFVSVFVGIGMLVVGMLVRLAKQRRAPLARGNAIPGDYRVLAKTDVPMAR